MSARLAIGFALAGGRSLRMGSDKALLPWEGSTLLDRALERLRQACGEVRILSGAEARYADRGVPVDVDELAGAGPLAGVLAGLRCLSLAPPPPPAGLFLAVDIPLAPVALLERLVALLEGHDAVVPVTLDGPHPLCAVYAVGCLAPIERRLAAGERKMTCFWPDVRVREVGEGELRAFGEPVELLRNINTPEDYRRLSGC